MDLKNGVFHGRPAYWLAILVLLAGLLLSLLWAVTFGSVDLKMGDVYRVILYKVTEALHFPVGDSEVYGSGSMSDIVWFVRLPRLVLAIGVGMALALAGVVMQAIVKNPLADPYVLGVSSGASLGATLAILVGVGSFLGSGYVGLVAFAGAFLVSMGVIALANIGGRATSVKLILAGTALSAICAAVSNFFLYVINTSSGALEAVVRWTMGSLAAASWDTNLWMLAVAVLGALFFWTQYRTLNLMLLGDEAAVTLGTDLHHRRIVYLLAASLLVGFAVYTAGIIGFVGLVIPHVVRILFGTDHKKLIPISALLGAIFLLWSDGGRAGFHLPDGPEEIRLWRWRLMDIRTEGVQAVLGGSAILKGVDIQVGQRELVGIIGPNGSGKSTLLKCIYRVLKPTGGAVLLDGRDLDQYSYRESARRIAVVAQHNYYNFEFSVQDVVMMGRAPHKRALDRDNADDFRLVAEALELVGMSGFARRSFSTLSGGEQQRVILARALAQQTPCLILDEPTNHLDIKYQLELMDIVKSLDRTVISAIHDLNIAAMYCDRLYAVKGGEIVGCGRPQEVLTEDFIRRVYEVEAKVFSDESGQLHILYHPAHRF